jgi:hypothetical protein
LLSPGISDSAASGRTVGNELPARPGVTWRLYIDPQRLPRMSRSSSLPLSRFFILALTATLVTGVERLDLTVFYDKDLLHGATEGTNGNSDEFEALDFMGGIDCV